MKINYLISMEAYFSFEDVYYLTVLIQLLKCKEKTVRSEEILGFG